jgi:2-dehydropantoate 2-reductase
LQFYVHREAIFMKIAIIGAGAMGRLFAWFLARGGHRPLLVCRRQEQVEAFLHQGLRVIDVEGILHTLPVEASLALHEDIVGAILTVKSYDTRAAAEMLRSAPHVPLLSLQNGMGNGQTLEEIIAPERFALGLTTYGATADGDTQVQYKGHGQTVVGDWLPGQEMSAAWWWSELLTACGHPTQVTEDIYTEIWRKAMVNIGINPFTALLEIQNGELLQQPELLLWMERAVEEAEAVAQAEGVLLTDSFTRVLEVCRLTATNRSSMLQDRLRGRKTEIDAMCGVVVRLGEKWGISTPVNSVLLELMTTTTSSVVREMLTRQLRERSS